MTVRLRALRLVILAGYLAAGFGLGYALIGPYIFILLPVTVIAMEPAFAWATGARARARVAANSTRTSLTSNQIEFHFRNRKPVVIDDDKEWGKLVEGWDSVWGVPITAVQVTNTTPDAKGKHELIWLRVPSRGDRQPARLCFTCMRDIAWPPRTAREAVAWTFQLCAADYKPAKAS